MWPSRVAPVLALSAILWVGLIRPAGAESWCAYPLWVHEWGVVVFGADGHATPPVGLPGYFHRQGPSSAPPSTGAVRDMPPDSGVRALPVMHFYSAGSLSSPVPVAVEVGFRQGDASAWYPQVDLRRPAVEANSPAAQAARQDLLRRRQALSVMGGARSPLPGDPTSQLAWDRLTLTARPQHAARSTRVPWVNDLRGLDAMWVNGRTESERFLFYEAGTREAVPLSLRRGPTWRSGHRHYVLSNGGAEAVHDVFVVHREAGRVFVFFAPSIPARASAGFVLEDHRVPESRLAAATSGRLRERLVDSAAPAPPAEYRWDMDNCVMQRDPAVPVDHAEGHRLYAREVDAMLRVWQDRFFARDGTTIVYREDPATLDRAMPLSVYTDMYNFVLLRRAGLAVWEGVPLP